MATIPVRDFHPGSIHYEHLRVFASHTRPGCICVDVSVHRRSDNKCTQLVLATLDEAGAMALIAAVKQALKEARQRERREARRAVKQAA